MKEKILEILNKHKTEIWGKNMPDREVVDADDFELIAEEIVNNLDIPVVSKSFCKCNCQGGEPNCQNESPLFRSRMHH